MRSFMPRNFCWWYSSSPTMITRLSTYSTVPARLAKIGMFEFWATAFSMPVPTIGTSGIRSGTAWRCMFEPISARFASSCSRNGMSAADTPMICFGETST